MAPEVTTKQTVRIVFGGICLLSALSNGCATTNRNKTLVLMGATGVVGGLIGGSAAPTGESPLAHGALWGGVSAAVAGAAGMFIFDEEKRADEAGRQNAALKKELEAFRGEIAVTGGSPEEIRVNGNPKFQKDVPEDLRPFVKPGQWKYSRIPTGRWYIQGDSQMSRQCLETFQLSPASLKSTDSGGLVRYPFAATPENVSVGNGTSEEPRSNQKNQSDPKEGAVSGESRVEKLK